MIAPAMPMGMFLDGTSIAISLGFAIFASLVALYHAFSPDEALNARARSQARKREEMRTNRIRPSRSPSREKTVAAVQGLLQRLDLTRGESSRNTIELLARAGWRSREHLTVFLGFRLASPIMLGVGSYSLAAILGGHGSTLRSALIGVVGIIAGAFAPSLFVRNSAQNRRKQIQLGLPDALDLFVICAEAGLSLDAAVSRVSREILSSSPELGDELGLTSIELGFLPNRGDALLNFARRVPETSIRNLVNTLSQTERYGTPLAQSLRVLATEFRDTRMMKAEEKAARLPAILTVPMMLFILPPLFVVLLGPAIIKVLAALPK